MSEIDPGVDLPEWDVEIDIDGTDDAPLAIGDSIRFAKTLSDEDLERFALASGDTNPLHLDDEVAGETRFGGRIAHGMLTASLISAVIGEQLPGHGTVYLGQTLTFLAPVYPGDEVTAEVRVASIDHARRRVTLDCLCRVGEKAVLKGEALVLAPSKKFD